MIIWLADFFICTKFSKYFQHTGNRISCEFWKDTTELTAPIGIQSALFYWNTWQKFYWRIASDWGIIFSDIKRKSDRPDGKILMGYRKTFNILVALFLALGVFANSALAEACFCGQACLHGLQPKAKTKINFLFHMRCSGTLCKSCDLENGRTLKAANSATQTVNVRILDTAFILSTLLVYPSTYHILEDFDSFYACGTVPSSLIYLQKSPLLC